MTPGYPGLEVGSCPNYKIYQNDLAFVDVSLTLCPCPKDYLKSSWTIGPQGSSLVSDVELVLALQTCQVLLHLPFFP